jgi:hypothetical protein
VPNEHTRGRPRRHEQIACPNPLHAGSHVKANGTRRTAAGLRRDYRCTPVGDSPHGFAVTIEPGEEEHPVYTPPPPCPLHGTASRRTRWGTYRNRQDGSTHRQRYRCVPHVDDPRYPNGHTFTPTLPRSHVEGGARCAECEQRRSVHSGGQAVSRRQSWPLRLVVEALEKLASGAETYGSIGRWAWGATRRSRSRPAALSDAERERRARVKTWERDCKEAEKEGRRKPRKPRGLSLDPLPSAKAKRRRRVDGNGEELPPRPVNPRSAEAHKRWHIGADWIEMYAPVLWQPLHERLLEEERREHRRRSRMDAERRSADARPSVLLLDDIPYQTKGSFGGSLTHRMTREYFVLGAATIVWPERVPGQPAPAPNDRFTHLRLLRAFATNEATSWELLLDELGFKPGVYEPDFVLADAGTGIVSAVGDYFERAIFVPSLYHIHNALNLALEKQTEGALMDTDAGRRLHPDISRHLGWLSAERFPTITDAQWHSWWNDFENLLRRLGLPTEALRSRRARYEDQVAATLEALRNNPGVPLSTGGFEAVFRNTVKRVLDGRAHGFKNLERTNNLLDLVVCRDRGVFEDRTACIEALRAEALRYEGWSAEPREVADPLPEEVDETYSSLRDRELLADIVRSRSVAA